MPIQLARALERLGVPAEQKAVAVGGAWATGEGPMIVVHSPIDGERLTAFAAATPADVARVAKAAAEAFRAWRMVPPPVRGQLVRRIGELVRQHKEDLATVVSYEVGKITQESLGEVQEMIDVCDFAVGLSRQLYGLTIASERPRHRLLEQWHPLGPIGVITAFNFPVAVWAWNAMLALVCGDPVVWKPSEKAPLSAIGCQALAARAIAETANVSTALVNLVIGVGGEAGQAIANCKLLPLVSATGSVAMGRAVAQRVAARLGRALLELGGNNGMIVAPTADPELAIRSIVFAAAGTCGQRCTTLRRLIVQERFYDSLFPRLIRAYSQLPIGNPLDDGVLVGPLIDATAFEQMQSALQQAAREGGKIYFGERVTTGVPPGGYYVRPALVEISPEAPIVQQETFAPILYLMRYQTLEEAIAIHNGVPQGLASSIVTNDMREAELFCSSAGSDCGIVNVNVGPSGAEIGGAFGGEKDTGGGRESGSDAWKVYMRRTTNTINYSSELPLAQGIRFEV